MIRNNEELSILSNALYWYIDKWDNSDHAKISPDTRADIEVAKKLFKRLNYLSSIGGLYRGEA